MLLALIYENTGEQLLPANLEDVQLLEDIHFYYSGRNGQRYADICAFHEEDTDLCQIVRRMEMEHFNTYRTNASFPFEGLRHP